MPIYCKNSLMKLKYIEQIIGKFLKRTFCNKNEFLEVPYIS